LTLAEQFTPIEEVLARVGGSVAGGEAQKKNFGSAAVTSGAGGVPAKVGAMETTVVAPRHQDPAAEAASPRETVVQAFSAAPAVSPSQSLDFDEDDDLPRPGKVWDSSGPSLKELLALEAAKNELAENVETVARPPAAQDGFANVEAVTATDLNAMWGSLLEMMAAHGPALQSLLAHGTFSCVEDGQAVIKYSKKNETFTKMLDRNGKKDLIRDGLSQLLGQSVGVRFVVEEGEAEPEAAPAQTPRAPEPGKDASPLRPSRPTPVVHEIPAAAPAIRITPELVDQLRQDPLVAMVMDKFNATVVKVE
jgi:hypothetical protein